MQERERRALKEIQASVVKGGEKVRWGEDSLSDEWFWGNCIAPCLSITLDYIHKPTTRTSHQID